MRDPGSVRQPSQQWCGHAASAASAWPELPGTRGDFEAALCLCGAKSVRAFFFLVKRLGAGLVSSPEGEWKMLKGEGLPRRVDSFLSLSLVVKGSWHDQRPPVQLGSETWRGYAYTGPGWDAADVLRRRLYGAKIGDLWPKQCR